MKRLFLILSMMLPCHAEPPSWSGIYPHLASFNEEGECGTGAVVPWADRLWVITYGPHLPHGSTDKLYEITPELEMTVRPESVGGTPANRMLHKESGQLVIGPYFIDKQRAVRVVSPASMPGRLTGNARHLTDPAGKVYFATMEEGLYEVDVKTLEVKGLIKDGNGLKKGYTKQSQPARVSSKLPGYHGKGLYSGQGRVVYANNGERGNAAVTEPSTPSGALGEWSGEGDWKLVRRNQFTEVTGPGGLEGNQNPETDPIWSTGWDAKSLILMVLDGGRWHSFRLPKASHCYDGAHGWNTEWPRIRDIGEKDMLMTMHGTFWRFPKTFTAANAAGIRPRSTYLKVIGDFCRWGDRLVFGCDDTARSAFLNERRGGDILAGPGQSQSNLWFTGLDTPDQLGPVIGRGSVWLADDVASGQVSEPFLFAGYERRGLHLAHRADTAVEFTLEVDKSGTGEWQTLRKVSVPAAGSKWEVFTGADAGEWIRVRAGGAATGVTAIFHYADADKRGTGSDAIFDGLAKLDDAPMTGALFRVLGKNRRSMIVAATELKGVAAGEPAYYELDAAMKLKPVATAPDAADIRLSTKVAGGTLGVDAASVVFTDDDGKVWRLPKGNAAYDARTVHPLFRVRREVSTEREIFHSHGTFYELPVDNAGGFAKIRPVASHSLAITDFASYRGLLVLGGVRGESANRHIIRSDDGKAAVWVGAFDDLWKLGKPVCTGGPWLDTAVTGGEPSVPYLFTGYDKKSLTLSHQGKEPVEFKVEVDVSGTGIWVPYKTLTVDADTTEAHDFPDDFQAYWVRVTASRDTTATARFEYR